MDVINYVKVGYILDRFKRDFPFFSDKDFSHDSAIEWIGDVLFKLPAAYILINKVGDCNNEGDPCIQIEDYRGTLPCDLILLEQLRDKETGCVLKRSTDLFLNSSEPEQTYDKEYNIQNNIIHTNFEEGELEISYKAIQLDEDKLPMIPNNERVIQCVVDFLARQIGFTQYMSNSLDSQKYSILNSRYATSFRKAKGSLQVLSPESLDNVMHMWNSLSRTNYARKYSYRDIGYNKR